MENQKKNIRILPEFLSTMVWCLKLSWDSSPFYTIVRISTEILLPVLTIAFSFLSKYILDLLSGALTAADSTKMLLYLFLCMAVLAITREGLRKTSQYCQSMHDDIIKGKVSLLMMDRSLNADLEYFDNPEYYDKLQAANRDTGMIANILWNVLTCISSTISLTIVMVVLGSANPLYGVLMVLAAFPSSIAAARYTKLVYQLSLDQINKMRRMSYCQGVATDRGHAQEMRLYNAGDHLKTCYQRLWSELFEEKKRMIRKRSVLTGSLELLPEMMVVLIGIHISFRIINGTGTVGDYSLYLGLTGQLWSAINQFSFSVMQIYDNQLMVDNLKTLDNFPQNISDQGKLHLKQIDTIEFQEVSFTYPGAKTAALKNISFRMHKEEKIVLVGINGSGKTTLIKLLLRLYNPESGSILINGRNIAEYRLKELRANFSVYFQEMDNYCFTLQGNFSIADEEQNTDTDAMREALKQAAAEDILQKASDDLQTSLTRHFDSAGIELSGGQHQKLALARTLFRRHTALILDEPSSNLDPKAEHDVFESLKRLTDGKMTIFTSHRLSNVFLADRIIVLERGHIVEDGTQQELLKNKKRYSELFRYQQEKFAAVQE